MGALGAGAALATVVGCGSPSPAAPVDRAPSIALPQGGANLLLEASPAGYSGLGRSELRLICDPVSGEWGLYEQKYSDDNEWEYELEADTPAGNPVRVAMKPGDEAYGYRLNEDGTVSNPTGAFRITCDGRRIPEQANPQ